MNWFAIVLIFGVLVSRAVASDWPQFRGPDGQGTIPATANPPIQWAETNAVRWKTPVPGLGYSSPIVVNGQVWLTTATEAGRSLRVLRFDLETGKLDLDIEVFRREAAEAVIAKDNGYASPTPVSDGERVFVSFGPNGNAALDGKTGLVHWRNQQLSYHHDGNGAGSSPVLCDDLMIIPCDGTDRRFIAALRKSTGEVAWAVRRSNSTAPGSDSKSFSTPLVWEFPGTKLVLSVFAHGIAAYDARSGREHWILDTPGTTVVPRPVVAEGTGLFCTGFPKPELWAVKLPTEAGQKPAVIWKTLRQVPAISSPVVSGGRTWFVSESGMASCVDVANGRTLWSERLGEPHSASPLVGNGRVYFFGQEGRTTIITTGETYAPLATNRLEKGCFASPAVVATALIVRTVSHLYRLENGSEGTSVPDSPGK